MPLKELTLQRQLEVAQLERNALEAQFEGLVPKKQPKWRQANALVKSLEIRLEKAQGRSGRPGGADVEEEATDDSEA